MGSWVGREGAIPGTRPSHPGTYIQSYLALRPYPRPYEGNLTGFHEVSQKGSRIDLRYDPELTQIDPHIDPPQTGPEMPSDARYPDPQKPMVYNRPYLVFY